MIGKSDSTIQANFGGTVSEKNLPSSATIADVERVFGLKKTSLSREGFDPVLDGGEPQEIPGKETKPFATLSIPVPEDKLARIMRIINE